MAASNELADQEKLSINPTGRVLIDGEMPQLTMK